MGPTDFLTMDEQRPAHATQTHDEAESPESRLVGSPIQDDLEATRAASPIAYVGPDAPPFLIQHGTHDRLVPVGQARVLADALRSQSVTVELIEIENADHCFWGVDTDGVMPAVIDFLTRHIGRAAIE
ncbi:MAG: prolyl oligopeptidase family serine peptidase [Hyphomicrobiales bacterium]|nr:prolyl oligopeptidase family serine peptidase [Hyphomicrobiales bacterium]